jgi:hypothetical protein
LGFPVLIVRLFAGRIGADSIGVNGKGANCSGVRFMNENPPSKDGDSGLDTLIFERADNGAALSKLYKESKKKVSEPAVRGDRGRDDDVSLRGLYMDKRKLSISFSASSWAERGADGEGYASLDGMSRVSSFIWFC